MKKIVLGCAAVLLSLGLLVGCNKEDDKVSKLGPEENENDGDVVSDVVSLTKTGKEGVLGLTQSSLLENLYWTGEVNSSGFGVLSTDFKEGVTVTEFTDEYGLYYLQVTIGGSEKYIGGSDSEHKSHITLESEPYALVWNKAHEAYYSDDGLYFLGNYSTFETLSWNQTSYIDQEGENIALICSEELPEVVAPYTLTQVTTAPTSGASYYFGFPNGNSYALFDGGVYNNYQLTCTSDINKAVLVTATSAEDNKWTFTFDLDSVNYTIYAYASESFGDISVVKTSELASTTGAVSTFTYNATDDRFEVTLSNGDWYISTYAQYSEISLSAASNTYAASHLYTLVEDEVE